MNRHRPGTKVLKSIHVAIAPGDRMKPVVEVSSARVSGSQSSSSETEGRLAEAEETKKKVVRFTAAQRTYMNAYSGPEPAIFEWSRQLGHLLMS